MAKDETMGDGGSLEGMMQSADARTLNMAGNAFADRGMWNEAIECYERSRALYRAAGDSHGEALVLNNLGATSYAIGDWDEAGRYYGEALAALRGQHPDTELLTLMNISFLRYAQGGKPDDMLDRAQRLAEELRRHDPLTKISWMRGDAAFAAGDDPARAFEFYAQACLHGSRAGDDLLDRTLTYIEEHVRVLHERGQTATALAFCDHLERFGQRHSLGSRFAARVQNIRSGVAAPPLLGGG